MIILNILKEWVFKPSIKFFIFFKCMWIVMDWYFQSEILNSPHLGKIFSSFCWVRIKAIFIKSNLLCSLLNLLVSGLFPCWFLKDILDSFSFYNVIFVKSLKPWIQKRYWVFFYSFSHQNSTLSRHYFIKFSA